LYSSSARFLFELLQNADDNKFTRGQYPWVAFQVHPNRIIVDCNEDGFNEDNIRAICDIGKSSKTASQGYIGEKGIGFKSVFMAAWKVHIQSGDYSFEFTHRRGDSGMGMLAPIWQSLRDQDLPADVTRITLHLHEYTDASENQTNQEIIKMQFDELQDTLLLFLRRLRTIKVSFHDAEGRQTKETVFSRTKAPGSDLVLIEKNCTVREKSRRRWFHITNYTARNLSKSENRDLSEAELANRTYATSEIVLAFPVTEQMVPIIDPQEVSAFLPIRRMGFSVSTLLSSVHSHFSTIRLFAIVSYSGGLRYSGKSPKYRDQLYEE
jgi:hypothetical protein